MNVAIKISLLASGLFLLLGMLVGILKFRYMLTSPTHTAPPYVDVAHRAAFLYSFAMLVVAKLLEYNSFPIAVQVIASGIVLLFLALTFAGYLSHGIMNKTDNLFRRRTFTTTWYMYLLIVGEIGGFSIIVWGFISTQFLDGR